MKKLNVGIIAGPYLPVPPVKYGGTEAVISALIEGSNKLDLFDSYLCAPQSSSVKGVELLSTCEEELMFPKTEDDKLHHSTLVEESDKILVEKIIELSEKVDIFHSHYLQGTSIITKLIEEKKIKKIPTLTTMHGAYDNNLKEFLEFNKESVFNSISLNQRLAYPPINWVGNVYNGIKCDDFPFNSNPKDHFVFLGRLDREKSPHIAIEFAMALGVEIKVAGKLDHLGNSYYDDILLPLFENPKVEFIGELNLKEKSKFLSEATLNLHPAIFREPFGLTVIEGMMTGTPAITHNIGSMSEIVYFNNIHQIGITGLIVECFNEALHKIENFLENHDREITSEIARLRFNHLKMAQNYYNLYNKVINL
jgi:glycosyltransferase involved in cell wall biosynthesis